MEYTLQTIEEFKNAFESATFFEQGKVLMKTVFLVNESQSVIEYLATKNYIIIGLTILEKKSVESNDFELYYAWWNFEQDVFDTKENMVLNSKQQAIEYLNSDFLKENKGLYVEISCSCDFVVTK